MDELAPLSVAVLTVSDTRTLEDGERYLAGADPVLWTPGEEAYDAPVDWNALASMAGCVVVPLFVIALILWLWLR